MVSTFTNSSEETIVCGFVKGEAIVECRRQDGGNVCVCTPLVTGRTVTLSKMKLSLNEEDKMVAMCVYPSGDRTHSGFVKGEAVTEMGRR